MDTKKRLTSTNGAPVADNQNVMTAGKRGPMLLQDVWYLEKLAHFDREVIPERRMHAKGSGASGISPSLMISPAIPKPISSLRSVRRQNCSPDSPRSQESGEQLMQNEISEDSQSSSTQETVTGTSSVTTPRYSSCGIP